MKKINPFIITLTLFTALFIGACFSQGFTINAALMALIGVLFYAFSLLLYQIWKRQ